MDLLHSGVLDADFFAEQGIFVVQASSWPESLTRAKGELAAQLLEKVGP